MLCAFLFLQFVIILPMKNVKSLVSVTAKNVLLIPLTYRRYMCTCKQEILINITSIGISGLKKKQHMLKTGSFAH